MLRGVGRDRGRFVPLPTTAQTNRGAQLQRLRSLAASDFECTSALLDMIPGSCLEFKGEFKGEGRGKNALGHPLTALTWLVNKLSSQRLSLDAGQIVTTGVVTPFELAAPGDRIVADFGLLGQVETGFPLAGA